ncbi:hypothetical protein [Lishizhenia tianjinensis]|uniref:hypothetical protein n=1 Tax=Lishizhenia tianjinensis TaxID=477690 RepID=UPI000B7EC77F|nr:hypothetical protein [Lishizhenia tianjinensis]
MRFQFAGVEREVGFIGGNYLLPTHTQYCYWGWAFECFVGERPCEALQERNEKPCHQERSKANSAPGQPA